MRIEGNVDRLGTALRGLALLSYPHEKIDVSILQCQTFAQEPCRGKETVGNRRDDGEAVDRTRPKAIARRHLVIANWPTDSRCVPTEFAPRPESRRPTEFGPGSESRQPSEFGAPPETLQPTELGPRPESHRPTEFGPRSEARQATAFGPPPETCQPTDFGPRPETRRSTKFSPRSEARQATAFAPPSRN